MANLMIADCLVPDCSSERHEVLEILEDEDGFLTGLHVKCLGCEETGYFRA